VPRTKILLLIVLAASAFTAPGAGSGGVPACAPGALEPQVDTNGASGRIYVYATVWNRSGHPCTARGRMTVSLLDAKSRRLLRIVGNPHVKVVRRRLRSRRNNLFRLEWENYCGPGRPMLFEARFGRRRDVERSNYPGARCESASAPSRLRTFHLPR
jgi:hypothetical protein